MQSTEKKPVASTERESAKPAPAEPRVLDAAELAAAAGGAAKRGIIFSD